MPRIYRKVPPEVRFWKWVDKSAGEDSCWIWIGGHSTEGYGCFALDGHRSIGAHCASWILHNGAIPKGLFVLHECDNPPCVNPRHLKLGTHGQNCADMVARGRSCVGDRQWQRKYPHLRKRGSRHHNSKLIEEQVLEIRRAYSAREENQYELAARFGVSQVLIGKIINRIAWSHI
jgi:hypothetical protein